MQFLIEDWKDFRLVVAAGVWGGIWSLSSYFVSRSHPVNLLSLAPVLLFAIAVLMIVIVTTISVYLAVYKGVPMEQHDDDESSPKKKRRLRWLTRRARRAEPEAPEPEPDAEAPEADSAPKPASG